MRERLTRRDFTFLGICLALAALSVALIVRYFDSAFPQASIDFKFDRNASRAVAERFLATQALATKDMKHAVRFDSDDAARIFLERSLGLARANALTRGAVHIWSWHHRWFRPLVEEELSVDVAPTGEIIAFAHRIPEDRAMPSTRDPRLVVLAFLRQIHVDPAALRLIEQSRRDLPHRVQRIFTFESIGTRPANAAYRHTVTVDGDLVTGYAQRVKVPDAWLRSYRELRSKNGAAGSVDLVFIAATLIAAVVVFIARLRRGDLRLKFLLGIGVAAIVLVGGSALNSLPSRLADYETTESFAGFVGNLVLLDVVMPSIGTAMFLIVICGAGEVLYRERQPRQLAIPRLGTWKALDSKRVFRSLVLGYALVAIFVAYQVIFYVVAQKYGAWAPAEVPYDDLLNSAVPWLAVVFAGFFPALSEEFLSRAFSIPFLEKLMRSRVAAIVLAGFIWGFGHATYPNQPFWIRGVEVGMAGVAAGFLFSRFGLLPLLIWHYTIDAVYTATLLFASGNAYYIASAALASLVFAIPLLLSIARYVRNGGFAPDDDLSNDTLPLHPPAAAEVVEASVAAAPFPPAVRVTRLRLVLCIVVVIAAAVAFAFATPTPDDAIDYRISEQTAKDIATAHLRRLAPGPLPKRIIATPVEGFRSWDPGSSREEGGVPGDFDSIAATYLVQHGLSARQLVNVFRYRIEAANWVVRFFTPMQKDEWFVEVDPRIGRAIGHHRYQDERAPGAQLPQPLALALAERAFVTYGLDPRAFVLKEALSFQQPARRDWLFHFEERTPIAAQAFRRVSVRVAGAQVTQFNKHIHVPDSVYREATTRTLLNVVLFAMKLAGAIAILALVIAGLVTASRKHGLPWRRALRWTAIAAIVPIATTFAGYEQMLFGYSTSVAWPTFRVALATDVVISVAKQLGLIFLAIAGIEAVAPYALSLFTREGRARFGRSAVVAALTALSIMVLVEVVSRAIAHAFPAAASVDFSVPDELGLPLPALLILARAALLALAGSAAVALFTHTARRYTAVITLVSVFCAAVDPLVTSAQAPVMLAHALVLAALVWIIARYVLAANPLAWPLAFFLGSTLSGAALLLQNQRADLMANGVALLVIAAAAAAWLAASRDGAPRNEHA
ncbi:MAG: CPBP family intramembrane metalloprotease [Acidobacteria bacterium]|nr:CPBP family intramembrane metalloprotease [Acidobacteriota bacterium]MBV9476314.1 CPBP family intramembrane metalloprotease [Acidobacteriota bacterium]